MVDLIVYTALGTAFALLIFYAFLGVGILREVWIDPDLNLAGRLFISTVVFLLFIGLSTAFVFSVVGFN